MNEFSVKFGGEPLQMNQPTNSSGEQSSHLEDYKSSSTD